MWKIINQKQHKHELATIELVEIDRAGHETETTLVLPLSTNTDFGLDKTLDDRAVAVLLRDFADLLFPMDDEPYASNGFDRYVDRDGEDLITPASNPFDDMAADIDDLDDEKEAILSYVFDDGR